MMTYFDAHCHWGGGGDQQFAFWPLPPEGGTTNTAETGKNALVVPALAGIGPGWRPKCELLGGDAGMGQFRMEEGIRMACCGTGPSDWDAVRRAAVAIPGMTAAYGIHPWLLRPEKDPGGWLAELERCLRADETAAVGEIGLDFAIRDCPSAVQRAAFLAQLRLAKMLDRVVVIHCVQAWGALLEALDQCGPLPRGFLLHAYGGSAELVTPLARQGAFFSFKLVPAGGKACEKTAARIRAVPRDRLLMESDLELSGCGPGVYGERLAQTAAFLADATGAGAASIVEQTFANAVGCFQKSKSVVER